MTLSTSHWLTLGFAILAACALVGLAFAMHWLVRLAPEPQPLSAARILFSASAGGAGAPESGQAGASTPRKVQRMGAVIGLRPEKKDYYIELHKNTWPGVLAQIRRSNIRNYSIFLAELEGKLYLFAYYEYVGDDYEADMKKMAEDPETQRWWKETDPCQIRLPNTPEGKWWMPIPEVFHTD